MTASEIDGIIAAYVNKQERKMFEAIKEMKAAGLSNTDIAFEFAGALLVFSPILLMFL